MRLSAAKSNPCLSRMLELPTSTLSSTVEAGVIVMRGTPVESPSASSPSLVSAVDAGSTPAWSTTLSLSAGGM